MACGDVCLSAKIGPAPLRFTVRLRASGRVDMHCLHQPPRAQDAGGRSSIGRRPCRPPANRFAASIKTDRSTCGNAIHRVVFRLVATVTVAPAARG